MILILNGKQLEGKGRHATTRLIKQDNKNYKIQSDDIHYHV